MCSLKNSTTWAIREDALSIGLGLARINMALETPIYPEIPHVLAGRSRVLPDRRSTWRESPEQAPRKDTRMDASRI